MRYYSDASPFNQPIPKGAAIHENSANIVARLNGLGPPAKLAVGATALDSRNRTQDWTHPLYIATFNDPVFEIASSGWQNPDVDRHAIYVPYYAKPAGGDDASMAVVQPPNAAGEVWEYDFWKAVAPWNGVQACNFGRRGLFNGTGLGDPGPPDRGGITAARFSNALGVIRYGEVVSGVIRHALFMSVKGWHGRVPPSVPQPKTGGLTGWVDDTDAPALGQKFYLPLTDAEIASHPTWQQVILLAMRRFGMYVGDNGGAPWALQLESGTQYVARGKPNPWVAFAQALGAKPDANGIYRLDFAAGVDLSRLRVLA